MKQEKTRLVENALGLLKNVAEAMHNDNCNMRAVISTTEKWFTDIICEPEIKEWLKENTFVIVIKHGMYVLSIQE